MVGGDGDPSKRGVVSTASYEAREYGVHSGLPLRTAARRCPEAVFLPVDREEYEAASATVMETLRGFGAVTEVMGWDEAFVGVETADPEGFAREIAARIRAATNLDATVGIGQNKLQAKLATGFGKPAGVFRLTYETWFDVLGAAGLRTPCGGSAPRRPAAWPRWASRRSATSPAPTRTRWRRSLARRPGRGWSGWPRGEDYSPVSSAPYGPRSRGRDIDSLRSTWTTGSRCAPKVARLAGRVAADVVAEERPAVRVVVKVRYAPFFTLSHSRVLPGPTADAGAIPEAALAALDRFTDRRPVRLLGVRAEFAG